ncbi:MAG: hypothetical protein WA799_08955 [Nitrosotalea sp.]
MKTEGSTNVEINNRRDALKKILERFRREGKTINRFTVQAPLRDAGYDVEVGTIYRDLTAVNRENTWVRDLVESNYSEYQQQIADSLAWIEKEAQEQYAKKWTLSKTTKKENHNGTSTESVVTQELAAPKASFLGIIAKVQELKMKHTHGDNINISAALLARELQDAKLQLQETAKKPDKTQTIDVLELARGKKNVPRKKTATKEA